MAYGWFPGCASSTTAARVSSPRLGLPQYRFGQPEAVHSDRDTTVDGDLREHRADLVGRKPVAKRPAHVGLEFLHFAERSNHSEIEDRALARAQRVVAPGLSPTILRDDVLEIAVEVVGALERAVHVLFAEHLAAHGEAAVIVVLVLVHVTPPGCTRGAQAPRAGFGLRKKEKRDRTWRHRLRCWPARPPRARAPALPLRTSRRVRAAPPAAAARPRA